MFQALHLQGVRAHVHTCVHTPGTTSKDTGVACLFIKIIRSNSVVSWSTRILLLEFHHHNDGSSPAHRAQVSLGVQPTLSQLHIPTAGHTGTPGMHTGTLLPQVLTTWTLVPSSAPSLGQQGPAAPLHIHSHPLATFLNCACGGGEGKGAFNMKERVFRKIAQDFQNPKPSSSSTSEYKTKHAFPQTSII